VEHVKAIRQKHPKMGVRKLLNLIQSPLELKGIEIGRDQLFDLLRRLNLLVKRRRKWVRTTDSKHWYNRYPNLVKELKLTGRNQVWVSDITYISTDEGYLYLSLITDAFSRKIVGYKVSDTLEAIGCLHALQMALRGVEVWESPIHHSDRGIQYSCHLYTDLLKKRGLRISMTEDDHCAENALAERVNGILKDEYMLDYRFKTKIQAKICCREVIRLYNTERPHLSLNFGIPNEVHDAEVSKQKILKTKPQKKDLNFHPQGGETGCRRLGV